MTTPNVLLSDSVLHRALVELGAGPDADLVVGDVLRQVAVTPQRRGIAWPVVSSRRALLLVMTGLLMVGLIASAFAVGQLQPSLVVAPSPTPSPLSTPSPQSTSALHEGIVIQAWNGLRGDDSVISQTLFERGSSSGTPLVSELPVDAINLRWSPDGNHVVYFTRSAPEGRLRIQVTGAFVADRDGSNPRPLNVPHPLGDYLNYIYGVGASWAPTSDLLALVWDTGSCSGVNCQSATGIDVFDAQGELVAAIDTPGGLGLNPVWSPDGSAIGWQTGVCEEGICRSNAFNWRTVVASGSDATTTLDVGANVNVTWGPDNRLQAVAFTDDGEIVELYTMATDGTDRREVEWPHPSIGVSWSPDGQLLIGQDYEANEIILRDVASGTERTLEVPESFGYGGWSPDMDQLVLIGEGTPIQTGGDLTSQFAFSLLNVDGTDDAVYLSDGEDFGWIPPATSE